MPVFASHFQLGFATLAHVVEVTSYRRAFQFLAQQPSLYNRSHGGSSRGCLQQQRNYVKCLRCQLNQRHVGFATLQRDNCISEARILAQVLQHCKDDVHHDRVCFAFLAGFCNTSPSHRGEMLQHQPNPSAPVMRTCVFNSHECAGFAALPLATGPTNQLKAHPLIYNRILNPL